MSSNGRSASESGIASPQLIAAAMESINTLAVWLREAGLDERAIAHFKFNALAQKVPRGETQDADAVQPFPSQVGGCGT